MVDKIKDVAKLFKAKLTKDETQELLIQATSEDNWQTPTSILHQIANAAAEFDEWNKMSTSILEKLKIKKWKKSLKTLNLVEFLLKNGPSNVIPTFKNEIYSFKAFQSYTCQEEGIDRGETVRQKAKLVIELITNDQYRNQQRTKAFNIKQKLAGNINNYQGKSTYNNQIVNTQIKGKYESFGSDNNASSKTPKNNNNVGYNSFDKNINQNNDNFNNVSTFQKVQKEISKAFKNKDALLDINESNQFQSNISSISYSNEYKSPSNTQSAINLTKKISETSAKKTPQIEKKPFTLPKNLNIKANGSPTKNNNVNIYQQQIDLNKQLNQKNVNINKEIDIFQFQDKKTKNPSSQKQLPLNLYEFDYTPISTSQKEIPYPESKPNNNNNLLRFDLLDMNSHSNTQQNSQPNNNNNSINLDFMQIQKQSTNTYPSQQNNIFTPSSTTKPNNTNPKDPKWAKQEFNLFDFQEPVKPPQININTYNNINLMDNNKNNNNNIGLTSNQNNNNNNIFSFPNVNNNINIYGNAGSNIQLTANTTTANLNMQYNNLSPLQLQQFQQFLQMQQQLNIKQ